MLGDEWRAPDQSYWVEGAWWCFMSGECVIMVGRWGELDGGQHVG